LIVSARIHALRKQPFSSHVPLLFQTFDLDQEAATNREQGQWKKPGAVKWESGGE
jgi:hypothetical protein